MNLSKRVSLTLAISTALACNAITSYAQTPSPSASTNSGAASGTLELEEIVVTAEHRSSDVQKTAASVAVRSGDELKQQGRFSLQQILEDIPGVTDTGPTGTTGSDAQGTSVVIRGTVPNAALAGSSISVVPTTAVYSDEVYEGIGGSYDIDRVEVLRGPQGTLYGRSATGGVVATHTRNPTLGEFGADLTAEYGSYDLRHATAVFNIPLGETLALRVAGNEYERDGYISKHGGAIQTTEAKAKLLYQPNADLSILLGWAVQDNHTRSGGETVGLSAPDTFAFTPADVSSGMDTSRQYWANVNLNLGFATLTYIPALRTWYQNVPGSVLAGPGGLTIVQPEATPFDQFVTQELRLASDAGSKLTWQIGGFYYDNRLSNTNSVHEQTTGALAFGSVTRKETKDIGVFAEATYPIADTWRLTAGLRYDTTYVNTDELYTSNQNAFHLPEDNLTLAIQGDAGINRFYNHTYKLRLEKDLTESNLLYASVSTGFLPGDVAAATGPGNQPLAFTFDEETLTAYELGSKNRFLDNALQINADVYFYRYSGYQQNINVGTTFNPSFVTATSPAKMKGLELEGLYQLTANDRVSLSYAYIDAYFFDQSAFFLNHVSQSAIPSISPNTGTVAYDHVLHFSGGSTLDFHGDARYASSFHSSALTQDELSAGLEPYDRIASEWIGDASGTWTTANGKYSVTGYVRNVGDNRYKYTVGLQGAAIENITATQYEPRTLGIVVHASF